MFSQRFSSNRSDSFLSLADEKVQLSRREKEELDKQRAKERYDKMHAEGKTDQAKADLARLAEIRRRREEEAAKRAASVAKPVPAKK